MSTDVNDLSALGYEYTCSCHRCARGNHRGRDGRICRNIDDSHNRRAMCHIDSLVTKLELHAITLPTTCFLPTSLRGLFHQIFIKQRTDSVET